MIISVVNRSDVDDVDVLKAVRAINRQIAEDFEPYWDLGGILRLQGKGGGSDREAMRGDAMIHLRSTGANYHWVEQAIPAGVVFTKIAEITHETFPWLHWTNMLSHEALELIADPQLNTLVKGPHPDHESREVFHYREVCDPVQADVYEIDGVLVSDFVLPHYYNAQGERKGRNDFLGTKLEAFRWNKDGEIGFWDPHAGARGQYVTYPQYDPGDIPRKKEKYKGKSGRKFRYAHKRSRGSSR
jgi:hypothetical protein